MTAAVINEQNGTETSDAASPLAAPVLAYAGVVLAAILLLHPTALAMAKTWATSSSYMHGFLVAPIALWMILTRKEARVGGAALPGLAIMAGGALIWLAGRAASVSLIEQFAFVSLLIGGAGTIFGARALSAWAFPLAFLYFMVPFGETLIPYLQTVTAHMAVSSLSAFGADVALNGYIITTPGGAFAVAEACAGLNFLIAALMVAAVFAYLNFESWTKRIVFLLFAALVAIIANGMRAVLIIMTASLTKDSWSIGPDHILVGWVFYAAILFLLVSIGVKFSDKQTWTSASMALTEAPRMTAFPALAAVAIISAAAAYGYFVVEKPVARTAPASLSLFNAPGWRILPPPGNWRASLPNADRTLAATYATKEETIYAAAGYFTHERRGAEIVSYDNRASDGDAWRKEGRMRAVVYIFGESAPTDITLLAGPEGRRLAVASAYWLDGEIYLDAWRLKLAQMKARLSGRNPDGGVLMVAASYHHDTDEALKSIRQFTTDVEPLRAWLARNKLL